MSVMHITVLFIAYLIIKLFSFSCTFVESFSGLVGNFVSNYFLNTESSPLILKSLGYQEYFV